MILLSALIILSIYDIKTREVPIVIIIIWSVLGLILNILNMNMSIVDMIGGITIGLIMIIISHLTEGNIGMGDSAAILMIGIYTGFLTGLYILFVATSICAAVSGILLVTKRATKKTQIPFIPFLCLSYVGGLML